MFVRRESICVTTSFNLNLAVNVTVALRIIAYYYMLNGVGLMHMDVLGI